MLSNFIRRIEIKSVIRDTRNSAFNSSLFNTDFDLLGGSFSRFSSFQTRNHRTIESSPKLQYFDTLQLRRGPAKLVQE